METTLFEKLTGSWTLVDLIEVPVNGGEITRPMGEKPKGLIIYNPDGYMSAQLMNSNRDNSSQEIINKSSTYLAYSGPFETDDDKQLVSHKMDVSLYSNLLGHTQKRIVTFEDDLLHLETEKPFISNSRLVIHKLTWKRV